MVTGYQLATGYTGYRHDHRAGWRMAIRLLCYGWRIIRYGGYLRLGCCYAAHYGTRRLLRRHTLGHILLVWLHGLNITISSQR